jgi:hypothetical protein
VLADTAGPPAIQSISSRQRHHLKKMIDKQDVVA